MMKKDNSFVEVDVTKKMIYHLQTQITPFTDLVG